MFDYLDYKCLSLRWVLKVITILLLVYKAMNIWAILIPIRALNNRSNSLLFSLSAPNDVWKFQTSYNNKSTWNSQSKLWDTLKVSFTGLMMRPELFQSIAIFINESSWQLCPPLLSFEVKLIELSATTNIIYLFNFHYI